ncbi:MAG TPA: hypothetical protein VM680_09180 [Verrucomicrobiae bacterium]|nr:hypothetical protein [Verrucomicrobiae bacterium]
MRVTILLFVVLALPTFSRELPKLPAGVTEIKFGELIQGRVGDRGLPVSQKAKSLDGKRVRILGHVVRREENAGGTFLLAPLPVQLHDEHYGLADDLPPTTVFVSAAPKSKNVLPYKRGLVLVTGTFRVGNREEADGRISTFRIEADPSTKILKRNNASVRKHKH